MSPNQQVDEDVLQEATPGLESMDAQDNVKAGAARQSASPDGLRADGARSASRNTPNGLRSSPPQSALDVAMDIDPPNEIPGVVHDADAGAKSDSEAETIVLPGKDGHSPSKKRKSIKHEDRSEDEEMEDAPPVKSEISGGDREGGDVPREDRIDEETMAVATAASNCIAKSGGKASETNSSATSALGKRKRPKQ